MHGETSTNWEKAVLRTCLSLARSPPAASEREAMRQKQISIFRGACECLVEDQSEISLEYTDPQSQHICFCGTREVGPSSSLVCDAVCLGKRARLGTSLVRRKEHSRTQKHSVTTHKQHNTKQHKTKHNAKHNTTQHNTTQHNTKGSATERASQRSQRSATLRGGARRTGGGREEG
eukprot:2698694-Rhodomonas_salina.1